MLDVKKVKLGYTKDIMICNIDDNMQITETQIKPLRITLEDLHTQIEKIKFDAFYQSIGGRDNKDSELEDAKLVPFNLLFYYLFITQEKIPTLLTMICEYINHFCVRKKGKGNFYTLKNEYKNNKDIRYSGCFFTIEALAGRISRAYNSFIREIELLFRFFQEKDFSARYSFQDDYGKHGVDLKVKYNEQIFGIRCSQKNKRSQEYNNRKTTTRRKQPFDENRVIYMNIDKNNHENCGDIWIFPELQYEKAKAKIKEKGGNLNEF